MSRCLRCGTECRALIRCNLSSRDVRGWVCAECLRSIECETGPIRSKRIQDFIRMETGGES